MQKRIKTARNEQILSLKNSGLSLAQLATAFDLSKGRIQQIVLDQRRRPVRNLLSEATIEKTVATGENSRNLQTKST